MWSPTTEQVTKPSKVKNEELIMIRLCGKLMKLLNFERLNFAGFPTITKELKVF